jgi:pSer/pThr/pTyr-binding forkhead associated (FHA) protein
MAARKEPAGGDAGRDKTVPMRRDDSAADIPARYAASLIVRSGPKKGAEYRISGSRTVLGRGDDADILLDDASVSRFHAAIEHSKTGFMLKDLGSTNGTLKDGVSIKEAPLVHGDRFQIGDTTFEFALAQTSGKSVYVIE